MDGLSVQTVAKEGNCLLRSLSLLLEDEGQQSRLRQKAVQYMYNKWEQFCPFVPVNDNNHLINTQQDYNMYMGKNGVFAVRIRDSVVTERQWPSKSTAH
jgi:hypothetical protein